MATLTELHSDRHGKLRVAENCALAMAKNQHIVNLRVTEVANAVGDFPIFATRSAHSRRWSLSAMTSFEPGSNLFVDGGDWLALHQPTILQTFPFYLMQAPGTEKGFTVGIEEDNPAFCAQHGHCLFDDRGKPSPYLKRVSAALEAEVNNDRFTSQFTETLQELDLLKSIDLLVTYEDGRINTIKGLSTVDEDGLKSLPDDTLATLHRKGYLLPAHALLISLFQLNALLRRHNRCGQFAAIRQLKLQVARDEMA